MIMDPFKTQEKNKEIQLAKKKQYKSELNDLRKVLKTLEGRRLIWWFLSESKLFRSSFTLNSMQTAFNEGLKDTGYELLRRINEVDINAFGQMQKEHISEQANKRAIRAQQRKEEDDE